MLARKHNFRPAIVEKDYYLTVPFIYGFGTGLPVLFLAVCVAYSAQSFSRWFRRFTRLEYYTKKVTGVIFILVGLYYIWTHIIMSIL